MAWTKLSVALESALSDMLEKRPEAVTLPASQQGEEVNKGGKSRIIHHPAFANGTHTRSALLMSRCMTTAFPTRSPSAAVVIHLRIVGGRQIEGRDNDLPAYRDGQPGGVARETVLRIVRGEAHSSPVLS